MNKLFTLLVLSVCTSFLFSQTITLKGSINTGNIGTDVWEYIDQNTGNVYAIAGGSGMTIIDVTDPTSPTEVAHVNNVPGFDVKVWSHYAYCSTSGGGTGGIVDLSDPNNPEVVGNFPSGHNIYIDERGYMYNSFPGVKIYDLNPDPTNPTFLIQVGNAGHDVTVRGNLMIDCHGGSGTNLYNVSDPSNPVLLGSITDPTISYHHQGDISKDGNFLYICDELGSHPQADISIWDISDPSDPNRVGEVADPNSTPHNLYVIDDYAYVSHYTAGFRVFDISNPSMLVLADEFDTNASSGEGFSGAFGVYPSPATGNIYINDGSGVYVFGFSELTTGIQDVEAMAFGLQSLSPNPATNVVQLNISSQVSRTIQMTLLNMNGQRVQTHSISTMAGTDIISLDVQALAAGIYFVQLSDGQSMTMTKLVVQ